MGDFDFPDAFIRKWKIPPSAAAGDTWLPGEVERTAAHAYIGQDRKEVKKRLEDGRIGGRQAGCWLDMNDCLVLFSDTDEKTLTEDEKTALERLQSYRAPTHQ
jgi:hypothetical protein